MRMTVFFLALMLMSCAADQPAPEPEPAGPASLTDLGKQLFFDKRLSGTGQMSCETCHLPEKGWTDGLPFSTRADGVVNTRHTPTLYNISAYQQFYWDGRAPTLEAQILAAWRNQMGGNPEAVSAALDAIPAYKTSFESLAGGPPNQERVLNALAAFVRTIESKDSPWDRYEANDRGAVQPEAVAGFDVFSTKAQCTLCHLPPSYTDAMFHNIGVGFDKPMPDNGRGQFLTTQLTQQNGGTPEQQAEARRMMGAFKTPTLRSITETAPYFHDGHAATLEEAVDFVLRGGIRNPTLDERLKPITLTAEERNQLLAFLRALTPAPQPFERPVLP
jgi:cytochrome c peroxidase